MRRSAGEVRLVRRASKERSVLIEVFEGIVRGIAAHIVSACSLTMFGVMPFRSSRNGGIKHTVAAGNSLDEDLHGVFGF